MVTPPAHNRRVEETQDSAVLAVIGRCVVAGCNRSAVRHLVVDVGGCQLAGIVCGHCERATRMAVFLLELAV
jgi:hypothetical protein